MSVRVRFAVDTPRGRYALGVLLSLVGVRWREARAGEDADVVYGGEGRRRIPAGPQDGWDDPRPALTRDGDLPIVHRPGGGTHVRGADARALGFDVVYAAYAFLTAPWERGDPRNDVGCPVGAEGWLERNGLLRDPVVHRYADVLGDLLGLERRRPEASLVVTHDVDRAFGRIFGRRARVTRLGRDLRSGRPAAVRRAAGIVRSFAQAPPADDFALWEELAARYSTTPAYFVASYGLFDDGAAAHDVAYDVRHPAVGARLRELAAAGAEIGIHFSLGWNHAPERLREERERLEEVLETPVRSARHHWWALGERPAEALRAQAEAGIAVDCSFGLNDRPGFRRGIAWPFRPFDPVREEQLEIWSLPTVVMDESLPPETAALELEALLETVRRRGGALVLDWHTDSPPAAVEEVVATAHAAGVSFRTPLELASEAGARTARTTIPAA